MAYQWIQLVESHFENTQFVLSLCGNTQFVESHFQNTLLVESLLGDSQLVQTDLEITLLLRFFFFFVTFRKYSVLSHILGVLNLLSHNFEISVHLIWFRFCEFHVRTLPVKLLYSLYESQPSNKHGPLVRNIWKLPYTGCYSHHSMSFVCVFSWCQAQEICLFPMHHKSKHRMQRHGIIG